MRLICPNCGAQYEVPDDVIPESGRDVQCSNCGDTWFQKHPDQDAELAEDLGQPLDDAQWDESDDDFTAGAIPAETAPETGFEEAAQADELADEMPETAWSDEGGEDDTAAPDEPESHATESHWPETAPGGLTGEDGDAPAADDMPAQRELPSDVRDVLREEAEREREARAADGGGLETQPDLGLDQPTDDASHREREARLRMARMRGMSENEAMSAAGLSQLAANSSRRDLLPDIEEINSTLRKDSERQAMAAEAEEAPVAPPKPQSGFSGGFAAILLAFALALVVYVFAGKLAGLVPQLEPILSAYVEMVNRGRLWLDGQVAALVQWLDAMSSEAPPASDS